MLNRCMPIVFRGNPLPTIIMEVIFWKYCSIPVCQSQAAQIDLHDDYLVMTNKQDGN